MKKLLTFLPFLAIVLAFTFFAMKDTDKPEVFLAESAIVGQDHAEVGELVRFKANGKDVEWQVLPETEDFQVFGEANQSMVVSFRKPGDYTIVAAVLNDSGLEIETIHLKVAGDTTSPQTPIVVVVPPKQPDVAPVPSVPLDRNITNRVNEWAKEAKLPNGLALALAAQLNDVAQEIEQGKLVTTQGIITRTTTKIQALELKPYLTLINNIQDLLASESDGGRLITPEDHAYVWRSMAAGLNEYASKKVQPVSKDKFIPYMTVGSSL